MSSPDPAITLALPDFTQTVIIGGGPAGCACALWLHQLGQDVLLLEASDRLGGLQTRSPYENLWIPGVQGQTGEAVAAALHRHVVDTRVPHALRLKVAQVALLPEGFRLDLGHTTVTARHIVLATGTTPRAGPFTASDRLAIGPGHPMEGLPVENRKIAILGGGDNAFDQARFVQQRGAAEVVIFSRSPPTAQVKLQTQVPNIKVRVGSYCADQSRLTINGEAFDAFGVMYGFDAVVPPGLDVARDKGFVRVDRTGATSLANVWACGEVTDYWHPCVTTACAHGIQVAKQISRQGL